MKDGAADLDFEEDDTDADEDQDSPAVSSQNTESAETNEGSSNQQYPYFLRRRSVTDERDKDLIVPVREETMKAMVDGRNALAEELGVAEVSKFDAREFALMVGLERIDEVAERMREEGFDALNSD